MQYAIIEINTSGVLKCQVDNLLDLQIVEALKDIFEHPDVNRIEFLQTLQLFSNPNAFNNSGKRTIRKKVA